MYEFYPDGFVPDGAFNKKAEPIRKLGYLLLWFENPQDSFEDWRWYGCNCPGCVGIGQYRVILRKIKSETVSELRFDGSFVRGGFEFSVSNMVLSLSNGVFSFSITCPENTDAFEALGAGIRYIMPANPAALNGRVKKSAAYFSNTVLTYRGSQAFNVTLDLNRLWDPRKTFIALPGGKYMSNITGRVGNPYILEPLDGAALVFSRYALSVYRDSRDGIHKTAQHDFYLSFSGRFRVNGARGILLGLSGTEYIGGCDIITFCPGYSAFLGEEFPDCKGSQTTSWISVCGDYYSMPEGMPLYAPADGILQLYESPAAVFPEPSKPMPFFPWERARVSDNIEPNKADNILYRQRETVLCGDIHMTQLSRADTDAETILVTPSGLCVGEDAGTWKWLGIAQTSDQPLPNVRISAITPEAKEKLLQKDCFIVITSFEEYLKFGSGNITVETGGWIISLFEENRNGSILIIKYSTSESIKEKLADNRTFIELLESAYVKDNAKESFRGFLDAVSSKQFEGVMLLNACARPDKNKLSAEAYAAAAMTGEPFLNCAYAAVKRSRVELVNEQINVMPSQIDALIAYASEGITQSGDNVLHTCKTVGLETVIRNSRVESFVSRTEILSKTLIGERLDEPRSIVMLGRCEIRNGAVVYRFTLENNVRLIPKNKPVESITVTGVSMVSNAEQSRFMISGIILMTQAEECDIFSYDKLFFEGAAIVYNEKFASEDLSAFRIRADKSNPRSGSISEVFGTSVDQYIIGSAEASPDELGFSSVDTPVRQGEITAGWNGMISRIALGNSGSLGADSPLSFEFISAWKDGRFYFGVRMNNVFSQRFSLQNLLSVGFQSVSLIKPADKAPIFKLNSLTLKLLGLSMPPKSTDLYIFGEGGKTGWFFGYSE